MFPIEQAALGIAMKLSLRTNDGRAVATLDTASATVYKKVNAGTHMLRIPPAWTYDNNIIQQVHDWWVRTGREPVFVIEAQDTGKTYRITWEDFHEVAYLMRWRQDSRQEQWAVLLKHWTIDGEEPEEQLKLF